MYGHSRAGDGSQHFVPYSRLYGARARTTCTEYVASTHIAALYAATTNEAYKLSKLTSISSVTSTATAAAACNCHDAHAKGSSANRDSPTNTAKSDNAQRFTRHTPSCKLALVPISAGNAGMRCWDIASLLRA
jgi:hypothetical protein